MGLTYSKLYEILQRLESRSILTLYSTRIPVPEETPPQFVRELSFNDSSLMIKSNTDR